MNVLAHRLIRWTGGVVAVGLILAAVLLTLARIALPFASEYRAELEQRVAGYLNTPVSIGEMEVEWHGLGPRLRLLDVEISGPPPAREPVHFDEALVELGLSLDGDRPYPLRISTIALRGCELEVALDEAGNLSMLGAEMPAEALVPRGETPPPFVRRLVGWLLGTDGLRLMDTDITVMGPDGGRWTIGDIRIDVLNRGVEHQLALSAVPPPEWGERVRAVVEASGRTFGDWQNWRGRAYVAGERLALPRWLGLYELPVTAGAGRADVEAWADFGGGRVEAITARTSATGLRLAAAASGAEVRFERLGGHLHWRNRAGGDWVLDVGDLDVRRSGRDWPAAGFSVARRSEGGAARWLAGADFLRLQDALALARLAPWPEAFAEAVTPREPRGDLRRLRLSGSGRDDFTLRARFDDAGWNAVGDLPGASGVDGRLSLVPGAARLRLATRDALVRAPGILPRPIPVSRAEGALVVDGLGGGALRVSSPGLELANGDVQGVARLDIARREHGLDLEIAADFRDGDLAATTRYLPVGPIPADVVDYLDRMLVAGRVTRGRLRLDGTAEAFPYRGGDGTFTVELDVRDAGLDYAPGWPGLEGLAGRVRIDGAALEVRADRGRLFGIEAETLRADIADLERGELAVSARADAPIDDLVRLVNESPLDEALGRVFDGASGRGRAPLTLDLAVPVRRPEAIEVDGRLAMDGVSIVQPRFQLDLRDLRGALDFSRAGVEMHGVRARIRGQPMVLNARTGQGSDRANLIRATGPLGVEELAAGGGGPLAQRIRGRASWNVQLRIPLEGSGAPVLSGVSDLRGTRIDLPAPLGKAADRARRLAFSLPLADAGALDLRVDYGEDVRAVAELLARETGIACERALLRFGPGPLGLPGDPGLHIRGRLTELALDGWLELAMGDAAGGRAPGFGGIRVQVTRATHGSRALSDLDLEVLRREDHWSLDVESNEISGSGRVPLAAGTGAPVRLRFEWVDLGLLGAGGGGGDGAGLAGTELDPAAIPPLDVRVERLKLRRGTLRDAALVTSPGDEALVIHRLEFTNEGVALAGQGRWRGPPRSRTSLRLELEGDDFGSGLAQLGYPGALVDGAGQVTADIAWPDAPWAPSLAGLEGFARIRLQDGLIPEVDPGVARLLGLFSLRALPQMLSLDFRGLVQKGYAFDTIEGRIDFEGGNAYSQGLEIDGPVGEMRISGRTGLVARDYDQTVRFQPELATSLPLIGGLAGGPVTGIAVALIQGVLRNVGADVEEASELRYTVTGSWADPKVERLGGGGGDPAAAGERRETSPEGRR